MRLSTLTLLPICLLVAGLFWVLPSYAQPTTQTFCSTDVPKRIPPVDTSGFTESDLDVSTCGVIRNVDVQLFITHTFDGDLQPVDLTSPDGTTLDLWSSVGGANDNFGTSCGLGNQNPDFILSDFALVPIPPFPGVPGTFLPQNPLFTFIGENSVVIEIAQSRASGVAVHLYARFLTGD